MSSPLDPDGSGASAQPDDWDASGLIKQRTEYFSLATGVTADLDDPKAGEVLAGEEGPVMEYVDVRLTKVAISRGSDSASSGTKKTYHSHSKGHSYITIFSPAVNEALRCVVDYYPSVDLSGNTIKVTEPFAILVFFERELTEYRNRLLLKPPDDSCANKYAYKHIGIVQDFVRSRVQKEVDAERERHARGFATFDMLWLLYKPGCDIYYDYSEVVEHNPFVLKDVTFLLANGTTSEYRLTCWNLDAWGGWAGPTIDTSEIRRFAGEIEIVKLRAYPCEYLKFAKDVTEEGAEKIREHFIARGKKWYQLIKAIKCYDFDGFTTSFPRRRYNSLVMVDRISHASWKDGGGLANIDLEDSVAHTCSPYIICSCDSCDKLIYEHAVKPKFSGYSKFDPDTVAELTDHQYFICDATVQAFVFKLRSWKNLHITGFREPVFNKTLFNNLVLKDSTKEMIKDLTEMYIRDTAIQSRLEETQYIDVTTVHRGIKPVQKQVTWSADYIQGKGDCLIFLFHGKPGVGKTYTAECIAEHTDRPLLTLTCADIGVKPEDIENNLMDWFKVAQDWGALVLIDEADIYMEERQTQDLERNHLVAGFLRALEYFKGILFLTTNRVGTFDEAFISRIHVPIYYPEFEDEQRIKIWDRFFEKLEEDRETTMRILQSTKDYTQSQELQDLNWNGREIRNAFQVAVALAEAQGQKDKEGRVLIKPDHIKASVSMSGEFKDYLEHVHRAPQNKKAAMMGLRYDAYGVGGGRGGRGQKGKDSAETY